MEVDNKTNPSPIKSLPNIVDLSKKRKLEAELLGLPISKHQCWKQILPSKPPTLIGLIPEVEEFSSCTTKRNVVDVYDVSETGSDKGSNSIPGNSDSTMSLPAEAKFRTMDAKYLVYDSASSSSSDWGFSSQGSRCSSDGTTVASRGVEKVLSSPVDVELEENLEESIVEYGNHIDYVYSGYGNYALEEYHGKEIEEILDSDEADPNVYLLSSGRWTVNNQEAQRATRKPTIDQEFEEYFSMLML